MIPKNSLKLTLRPELDGTTIWFYEKPTSVTRGSWNGFSLPKYNSDNEELYFRIKTPDRWNGETDLKVKITGYLASAEDVGDKIKLEMAGSVADCYNSVISNTPTQTKYGEATVVTDRSAQYNVYCIDINFTSTNINTGDLVSGRLRRVSSTGTDISGEFVVLDVVVEFKRDKIGGKV